MARLILTEEAAERSTLSIGVAFYDEADETITPGSITWTLTTIYGQAINSRRDVAVTPPESSITIRLSGDDLALLGEMDTGVRLMLVEATYLAGAGAAQLREEIEFTIRRLAGVSA